MASHLIRKGVVDTIEQEQKVLNFDCNEYYSLNRYETSAASDETMHSSLHCRGNSSQLECFVCFSRASVAQKYLVHVI